MSLQQIYHALAVLEKHTELKDYVKNFYGQHGFMFSVKTDPKSIQLERQLNDLLNENGYHSGSSWGCMLQTIKAILRDEVTIQQLEEEKRDFIARRDNARRDNARQLVIE
jgi:hypothetical protein